MIIIFKGARPSSSPRGRGCGSGAEGSSEVHAPGVPSHPVRLHTNRVHFGLFSFASSISKGIDQSSRSRTGNSRVFLFFFPIQRRLRGHCGRRAVHPVLGSLGPVQESDARYAGVGADETGYRDRRTGCPGESVCGNGGVRQALCRTEQRVEGEDPRARFPHDPRQLTAGGL